MNIAKVLDTESIHILNECLIELGDCFQRLHVINY